MRRSQSLALSRRPGALASLARSGDFPAPLNAVTRLRHGSDSGARADLSAFQWPRCRPWVEIKLGAMPDMMTAKMVSSTLVGGSCMGNGNGDGTHWNTSRR